MIRLALIAAFLTSLGPAAGKPNLVIILADDMGYSDSGCSAMPAALSHRHPLQP